VLVFGLVLDLMTLPAGIDKVAGGFQFLEGPVWHPARATLYFSDIPASRIYAWREGELSVFREPSGQANGNALDPQGRLVTCEHETRRVSRTEPDGTVVPLATHYDGKRLNSPNDVVCRRDGSVFFSDPPYGVKPEHRELGFQGVFRVSRARRPDAPPDVALLVDDFVKPNGLCFSPDESLLYIADTELGLVRVFDVQPDGTITNSRRFCAVERPDGMRADAAGNLYVAAMAAVEVFDPQGAKLGTIAVPERPANLCFGGPDRRTLFICARTSLYACRVGV
jgi:sugar lactone lactonase YvrE